MRNNYALITGASEGLGKFLVVECARRGMGLVLVALPGSGLEHVAGYVRRTYEVDVRCIETDLSNPESCYSIYEKVKADNICISVLVNNAGMGGTFPFDDRSTEFYSRLIDLNVTTPTLLCRLFIEDLRQCRGYILNVSSLAGIFHLPQKQVYSGTKSYVLAFSRSLRQELKRQGISVSVLCPGGMNTYWRLLMDNRVSGTWIGRQSIMEPSEVAAIAIRKMFRKKGIIIPGIWNQMFLFWNRIIPESLKNLLMDYQIAKTTRMRKVPDIPRGMRVATVKA